MGQKQAKGESYSTEDECEGLRQLEEAVLRGNTLKCHEYLQKINVNTPLIAHLRTPLVVATNNNNLKMVKFLLRYKNSCETKMAALEFALASVGKEVDLEIVKILVASGAFITSPRIMCQFFLKNSNRPKLREAVVLMILEFFNSRPYRAYDGCPRSQRYLLLGTLLKLTTLVAFNMWGYSILQKDHQFIPGLSPYRLLHSLMLTGASAHSFWDPVFKEETEKTFHNSYSMTFVTHAHAINTPRIDLAIISLFVRTSTGRVVPMKVDQMLYHYANYYTRYNVCENLIENIEGILKILVLTGVPLQRSKLYYFANTQEVTSPSAKRREAVRKIRNACERIKLSLPMSLQQCCRLCVQKHINGPNILFIMKNITNWPKSIKDIMTLENFPYVKSLEKIQTS